MAIIFSNTKDEIMLEDYDEDDYDSGGTGHGDISYSDADQGL